MNSISVQLIDYMGTDASIVNSARVCVRGIDAKDIDDLEEKDDKLIAFLAKNRHMTPFEHNSITLRIEVPIFIARQIFRHRTFSYNEESRRYTSEEVMFWWPEMWRAQNKSGNKQGSLFDCDMKQELLGKIYDNVIKTCESAYTQLVEAGVANEQARAVLPQSMITKFWMTGNLRNWAHFLSLRTDAHAQSEVQEMANACAEIIGELFPVGLRELMQSASAVPSTE